MIIGISIGIIIGFIWGLWLGGTKSVIQGPLSIAEMEGWDKGFDECLAACKKSKINFSKAL